MSSPKRTTPRSRGSFALIGPVAAVLLFTLPGSAHPQASDPHARQDQRRKYALLVGCTEYPNLGKYCQLVGPANDVPLYLELLTKSEDGFGFPEANVTTLVGWPEEPEKRPTYANILAALEDLAAKAGRQTQIFILLAGHGKQVPVPESETLLGRSDSELDGMDEVFLPADVDLWREGGLGAALSDNRIREFLTRMRGKGADVWIVFDCCHSGGGDSDCPQQSHGSVALVDHGVGGGVRVTIMATPWRHCSMGLSQQGQFAAGREAGSPSEASAGLLLRWAGSCACFSTVSSNFSRSIGLLR